MAVAERLCTPDERVVAELSPHDAAQQTFADPNVVVLVRSQVRPQPVRMGLADSATTSASPKDKGLITKQEVRAVSLARMQLRADSRVWDIGAGGGSVGLEAAACARKAMWAIEKNEADHAIAGQNARAFGVSNHAGARKAPEGWMRGLTRTPFFIGGSAASCKS